MQSVTELQGGHQYFLSSKKDTIKVNLIRHNASFVRLVHPRNFKVPWMLTQQIFNSFK